MPHQCIKCQATFAQANGSIANGCPNCGSKIFFYSRRPAADREPLSDPAHLATDVRSLIRTETEVERPVSLDVESIRVVAPGRYELDVGRMLSREQPVISRIEEGKYDIDLEPKNAFSRPSPR